MQAQQIALPFAEKTILHELADRHPYWRFTANAIDIYVEIDTPQIIATPTTFVRLPLIASTVYSAERTNQIDSRLIELVQQQIEFNRSFN